MDSVTLDLELMPNVKPQETSKPSLTNQLSVVGVISEISTRWFDI